MEKILMNLNTFKWRSFKTRVTFFMLSIFLTRIRVLAVCVRRMRRQDKQRLLGERQFAMVDRGACL
jgi:heme/copper-type cytochrome/quinol oxidase subunit 4